MSDNIQEPVHHPVAEVEPEVLELGSRLGLTDMVLFDRDGSGTSPLIHARWRGAPVALNLRTGLAGGFSVAFYRGPQPETLDEDGELYQESEWDEVADTGYGDPEVGIIMGVALLEAYSKGREYQYKDTPSATPASRGEDARNDA